MKTILVLIISAFSYSLFGQHPSAQMDIESTDKGILIPRTDTSSVVTPVASGLLIYQTIDDAFYYYDGTKWISIGGNASSNNSSITDNDNDTFINVESSSDSDTIQFSTSNLQQMSLNDKYLHLIFGMGSVFIGDQTGINDANVNNRNTAIGSESFSDNVTGIFNVAVGRKALHNNLNSFNVAVGNRALRDNTFGDGNCGIGMGAMQKNTSGDFNVGVGYSALSENTTGLRNTAIGTSALRDNTLGDWNSAVGWRASYYNVSGATNVSMGVKAHEENISGDNNTSLGAFALQRNKKDNNVSIGYSSLSFNINGQNNVALGKDAGYNSTGSSNVFIGFESGKNETGSEKLFIDNTSTASPLIYGEFDSNLLNINGDFKVTTDGNEIMTSSYNNVDNYGEVTIKDVMTLTPRSLPPSSPSKGMIYYDSDDDFIYYWNGSTWINL